MRSIYSLRAFSRSAKSSARAFPIAGKIMIFAAVIVSLLAGESCAAMIDSFDVGDVGVLDLLVYPGNTSLTKMSTGLNTTQVIGGTREANMQLISGGVAYATVNLGGGGSLDFSEGAATKGKLTLTWDGDNSAGLNYTGLGGKDLTDVGLSTGLVADIISMDLPIVFRVEIYTDASNYSYYESPMSVSTGPQYLPFSTIDAYGTVGSGADYTKVGAIRFIIDGSGTPGYPDTDLRLNQVYSGVPEPNIALLLLSGWIALGLGMWWRKK